MNDYFGKSSFQNGNWSGLNGQVTGAPHLGCAECKAKKEAALRARAMGSRDPEIWSNDLSCSKCQKKKKRRLQREQAMSLQGISKDIFGRNVGGSRSLLGLGDPGDLEEAETLSCATCGKDKAKKDEELEGSAYRPACGLGQTCPVGGAPTLPADTACQQTSTGDIICSNGVVYSKDCPYAPKVNVEGVAADVGGAPQTPAPLSAAAPVTATPPAPAGSGINPLIAVAGAALLGGIAYLIFK